MANSDQERKEITFEKLVELRTLTDKLSDLLRNQAESYLAALKPLLSPHRVLGKTSIGGPSRAATQIREQFQEIAGKPFNLRAQVEEDHLEALENRLILYPWEYNFRAAGDAEGREITISSPVRWILTYKSEYTLSRFRGVAAGREERRTDETREFLLNALAVKMVFETFPSLGAILADLRFPVTVRKADDLGSLPLLTIDACLPSFLPPDDLILKTVAFSGISAFIELIDVEGLDRVADPIKERVRAALS